MDRLGFVLVDCLKGGKIMFLRRKSFGLGQNLLALGVGSAGLWALSGVQRADSIDVLIEPVIRVEEDWTLVLNEPDNAVDSPQFHTVMSPDNHLESYYAQVTWNYKQQPDFTSGGLELSACDGEEALRSRSVETRQLSTSAETITWSQSLETDGTALKFTVFNGNGSTWGTFGKDMTIDMDAYLPLLNAYNSYVSQENSCITYGTNRVDLLMITQVRRYGVSGLLSTDNTPRIVFDLGGE